MKAVIYTRYSPRPNAQECASCEKQEKRCEDYAKSQKYDIWGYYRDESVSGGDLDRPGL